MHDINRLSSHTTVDYEPELKGINNLVLYLVGCLHHSIKYPSSIDIYVHHNPYRNPQQETSTLEIYPMVS